MLLVREQLPPINEIDLSLVLNFFWHNHFLIGDAVLRGRYHFKPFIIIRGL